MQSRVALISAALAGWTVPALADSYVPAFVDPYGQAVTTYQEWSGFASTAGPNAPAAFINGNLGTLNAYDATAPGDGAFLTGGHIYSQGIIHPTVIIPEQNLGAGHYTSITLQVDTLGNEPNLSTFLATGSDGTVETPNAILPLTHTPLGGFGGFQDDYEVSWLLAGNARQYTFSFNSDSGSLSFAAARVDTLVGVPEPTTLGLLSAGLLLRRRRR